ncbi:MAG: hypothetical protein HY000_07690 [Planctomycetes bacterium]|nr:hypothetical protein [Planctomycetota bacterium]
MLTPDRSKIVFQETDVTSPVGILGTNDAYDLTLFKDSTDASKGVLVVKMDVQIIFKTGKDSKGKKLEWDHASRQQFARDYSGAVASVWNEKWRIATTSTVAAVKNVGVVFELNLITSGWNISEHWEIDVYKADQWQQNYVSQFTGGSQQHSSSVDQTVKHYKAGCTGPANVCAITQRPSAHEFGHMLGLNDEYPAAKDNTNWVSDADSIMHSGEIVRPRHYAIFADWLTKQHSTLASLAKEKIDFKVDGRWDMTSAKL